MRESAVRSCELCGLPAPADAPPTEGAADDRARLSWHPRHVQRVHRFCLVETGSWGCSRCGRAFPVEASWAVDHRLDPDTSVRTFVVCPDCAAAVRPTRLRVDVQTIAASGHRSLQALVDFVRSRRRADDRELLLRAEDTLRLAASEDRPIRELVDDLAARGLVQVT